jgi:hypothetical protein
MNRQTSEDFRNYGLIRVTLRGSEKPAILLVFRLKFWDHSFSCQTDAGSEAAGLLLHLVIWKNSGLDESRFSQVKGIADN